MTRLAALLTLCTLAACQPDVAPTGPDDTCRLAAFEGLVGRDIALVGFPPDLTHRVIAPGTAVTMDYNPERLNILTDDAGVVQGLRCG